MLCETEQQRPLFSIFAFNFWNSKTKYIYNFFIFQFIPYKEGIFKPHIREL